MTGAARLTFGLLLGWSGNGHEARHQRRYRGKGMMHEARRRFRGLRHKAGNLLEKQARF